MCERCPMRTRSKILYFQLCAPQVTLTGPSAFARIWAPHVLHEPTHPSSSSVRRCGTAVQSPDDVALGHK